MYVLIYIDFSPKQLVYVFTTRVSVRSWFLKLFDNVNFF